MLASRHAWGNHPKMNLVQLWSFIGAMLIVAGCSRPLQVQAYVGGGL